MNQMSKIRCCNCCNGGENNQLEIEKCVWYINRRQYKCLDNVLLKAGTMKEISMSVLKSKLHEYLDELYRNIRCGRKRKNFQL